jgi:hypothetical protein
MTASRSDLVDLPFWPRGLSQEQAAAYVGVSSGTFLEEVEAGIWPAGQRRGPRGGRVVWDRKQLDLRYDGLSRIGGAITDEEILGRLE